MGGMPQSNWQRSVSWSHSSEVIDFWTCRFGWRKSWRVEAVKHFYKCNGNAAAAARRLSEEFDIHEVQGRNIKNIVVKLEETGSLNDLPRSGRSCSATADVKGDELMLSLRRSPQKSSRRLSSELMVSPSSVLRLLYTRGTSFLTFHDYFMTYTTAMLTDDCNL